jgi:general secretion pathway protein A
VGATGRTLEQILRDNPAQTTTQAAFANLFAIWNVDYQPGNVRACEQARQNMLSCLFQRGSLTQIERLDRPVILTLQDDDGGVHQVVLAGLNGTDANIKLGDEVVSVPLAMVAQLWFGEYLLLWRPQIDEVKSFYQGMRDPDVAWIRSSLSTILGNSIEATDADYFDENLEKYVRQYQIAKHLNADGMVGQQTQIAINSDLGIDAPRLIRAN